ncbi:probable protein phosphatase 2C 42 [Zingiber officinale]|uniref:probable protein phosphatase 2C 42 n=1 Tax=Zingiber officinale TaxID=94328 RepID=UPI001C4C8502|nr:probable protein phosphatase 2C 42 [Zingiber officinale]
MLRPSMRLLSSLLRSFAGKGEGAGGSDGAAGREGQEGLLWYRDHGPCSAGEFSMAVVQANQILEDQSQIESGPFGTFVGIYDGHGGPDAARFVCDNLFSHFREISVGPQGVTCDSIRRAFLATEEKFIELVGQLWSSRPDIATTGSCCLVGVVCQRTLYVANLGDSRVVLGRKVGNTGEIAAIALSTEHNANMEAVRQELRSQHPNDPNIVVLKHGVWRVKGIIQVSRSIGDELRRTKNQAKDVVSENDDTGSESMNSTMYPRDKLLQKSTSVNEKDVCNVRGMRSREEASSRRLELGSAKTMMQARVADLTKLKDAEIEAAAAKEMASLGLAPVGSNEGT